MLTRARRVLAVLIAVLGVQLAPVAAHADIPNPSDVIILSTPQPSTSTCLLQYHYIFDQPLTGTPVQGPNGETDFVWHADAHGGVSSADTCVTGIMVQTQLTDSTPMPNCPPVLQSPVYTTVNYGPPQWMLGGQTDYEADNQADWQVPYFDGPGTSSSAFGAVTGALRTQATPSSLPLRCYRAHSTVTQTDTGYYENSVHEFVPYCTQQTSYEFVSTPAGPEQVGSPIVESTTC